MDNKGAKRVHTVHQNAGIKNNEMLNILKGDLSCKMHFVMSFIHKYVSPVRRGTHAASENKTLSLFLRTQISKNVGTTSGYRFAADMT